MSANATEFVSSARPEPELAADHRPPATSHSSTQFVSSASAPPLPSAELTTDHRPPTTSRQLTTDN
jgi:hypothetical protein